MIHLRRLAIAAAVIGLVYWLVTPSNELPEPEDYGKAHVLQGFDPQGKGYDLKDFAGQVVLVDVWATWCPPCRAEIPDLVKLYDKERAKGFTVIGVAVDKNSEAVEPFAKANGIDYPLILKPDGAAGWNTGGLPSGFLVARDGTVIRIYEGGKDMDFLRRDVEAALAR